MSKQRARLHFMCGKMAAGKWFRVLLEGTGVEHELHFIDVPDDLCKRQLRQRSAALPAGSAWTTDAEFDALTAYFEPPAADEKFNVIRHERASTQEHDEVAGHR
jgi:hypothetical protein